MDYSLLFVLVVFYFGELDQYVQPVWAFTCKH